MVSATAQAPAVTALLDDVDVLRKQAAAALDQGSRSEMGQYMTPPAVSRLMASMFTVPRKHVRLLDAGAGVGSLTAAAVEAFLARDDAPVTIEVVAFELEPILVEYLARTLDLCQRACEEAAVEFVATVEQAEFLEAAAREHQGPTQPRFNCAIQNPPYRKINAGSSERESCRAMGVEVSNLYAGFVAGTVHLLEDGAELVAITPRSFANGPYFKQFRKFLLDKTAFRRLHVFDSRDQAFRDDDVLQENVILCAERTDAVPETVEISASRTADAPVRARRVPWGRVVYERDPECFVHLIDSEEGDAVADQLARLDNYLTDVGIRVSTGPVVDFRMPDGTLLAETRDGAVPLLYPTHLNGGSVLWPREKAKHNALVLNDATQIWMVPRGNYVLVRRFTAKEERRRVVAAVYEVDEIPTPFVGLENHLNYFHEGGHGLSLELARGLSAYLNSTVVDVYFRQFSGHTQVNAADLRNIPYPTRERLEAAGRALGTSLLSQDDADAAVREFFFN